MESRIPLNLVDLPSAFSYCRPAPRRTFVVGFLHLIVKLIYPLAQQQSWCKCKCTDETLGRATLKHWNWIHWMRCPAGIEWGKSIIIQALYRDKRWTKTWRENTNNVYQLPGLENWDHLYGACNGPLYRQFIKRRLTNATLCFWALRKTAFHL